MVSNAREDFPEPDSPVMTTSWSRGISTSMFLRLCSRAPRTRIRSLAIRRHSNSSAHRPRLPLHRADPPAMRLDDRVRAPASPAQPRSFLGEASEGAVEAPSDEVHYPTCLTSPST